MSDARERALEALDAYERAMHASGLDPHVLLPVGELLFAHREGDWDGPIWWIPLPDEIAALYRGSFEPGERVQVRREQ